MAYFYFLIPGLVSANAGTVRGEDEPCPSYLHLPWVTSLWAAALGG